MTRLHASLAALTLLAACATADRDVAVRHFPSTAFHEGTPFHLFVFDPEEERPLSERIRIARNQIRAEPDCTWKDVPTVVIAEATARQGDPWAETLLAAPVDCRA